MGRVGITVQTGGNVVPRKSYSYNVMSENKKCSKCGKPLKKRIEMEHPKFTLCYRCYIGLPIKGDENERI
jgi:hypothetical protein